MGGPRTPTLPSFNSTPLLGEHLNQLDKASAAAHTFFLANPEHMEMWQNLEHYKLLEGVQESHFQDREARPHQQAFTSGVKHYDAGDYEKAISFFEEALLEYSKADVECRALCEGPQKFEEHEYLDYYPGLYKAISDHYTQILICEHECVRDLATRPGRLSPMENYLPLHYDYLQYAYFKGTAIGVHSSSPSEKRTLASETDAGLREGGPVPYDEVQMVLGSEALNGSQRVLLDGLLTEQECRDLKSAAQTITMAGDGYSGKMSPHTPNEKFEGATVLKALQYLV
ncbi:UNVERIFIED_CONTAM: hypothetical protein FKN15_002858 [Acipenser sinensis]